MFSGTAEALGRLIEQPEPGRDVRGRGGCRDDPYCVARRHPLDFVAGLKAVLLVDGLGDGHLILGSDLGHILTISRIESLFETPCEL